MPAFIHACVIQGSGIPSSFPIIWKPEVSGSGIPISPMTRTKVLFLVKHYIFYLRFLNIFVGGLTVKGFHCEGLSYTKSIFWDAQTSFIL